MFGRTRQNEPETALDEALRILRLASVGVLVFSFALNLLMLSSPVYMLQVYDRVVASGHLMTLLYLTLILLVAHGVLGALDAVRSFSLARMGSWLQRRLSPILIRASLRTAVGGAPPTAQPLRDLNQLQNFLGAQGIVPLIDAPWVPFFIVVLWMLHDALGAFALASTALLLVLAILNEMTTRQSLARANEANVVAVGQAEASLRNAEAVEAMGMERALVDRFERLNGRAMDSQSRATEASSVIMGFTKFLRIFLQSGILGVGAYLVVKGELTAGGMIAGSILLSRALAPVEQSIGIWRNVVATRTSLRRLQALLRVVPPDTERMTLPPPQGYLRVEGVTYAPVGMARPVLRGVTFEAAPGEVVGLIGPSAAGKSTLCRLIVGVHRPNSGQVRLDGADVLHWDREQFGAFVGYLPQDVELFQGTVRENIARMTAGDPQAVVAAAKAADVHEMILALPKGYDTEIGSRGAVLSGGQRQRIGLARALYCEPKLIVLDEPNSSLDSEGEIALQATIARLKARGSTVIMVAHRPSALVHVDKLVVLQNGAVTHFGPKAEVIEAMNRRGPVPVRTGNEPQIAGLKRASEGKA